MKIQKPTISFALAIGLLVLSGTQITFAVNTIAHAETLSSKGAITLQDGTVPSSGGVTIGYFSSSAPSDALIQSWTADNAMANLISNGWVDIRTVVATGAGMQNGGDWDWPGGGSPGTTGTKIGGTYNWIYDAAKANTQLYVFGFNNGSSSFGYNAGAVVGPSLLAITSSSFASSTQWIALRATNWLLPNSDNSALNINIADVDTAGELIMGTETGANSFRDLGMVPEPSTGALMMIGAFGLVAMRRLRKV